MAGSMSAADRQKLLLQQEIAKLSGAISRHAANPLHQSSYHPYARGGSSTGRGTIRGRGTRGRGRGGYSLDLRKSTAPISEPKEAGEISKSPSPAPPPVTPATNWVKTNNKGNMSLMTAETKAKLSARPKPLRKPKIPPQIQVLSSSSTSQGQRVVIDGVIFQFEQDGKKLTRIGELPATSVGTPTRKRVDYGGQKYRRTSRGNLVQSKANTPCRYYTKTGRCNKALTCPYAHIPDRLAICPKFLRGTCPHTAETCPLSHRPSTHNTPSCVHFQATSTCRNGSDCPYPHVKVAPDAPICEAFARGGWCDAEPGTCPNLHVWECPEYREKGTCARGGRCGLKHVVKVEKSQPVKSAEGSFEGNTDFVTLDQGSPPEVSEEEDPEEDHSDGSGESDVSDEEADEVLDIVA